MHEFGQVKFRHVSSRGRPTPSRTATVPGFMMYTQTDLAAPLTAGIIVNQSKDGIPCIRFGWVPSDCSAPILWLKLDVDRPTGVINGKRNMV